MKKILGLTLAFMLVATQSWAAITYSTSIVSGPYSVGGKSKQVVASIDLAGTYETNGFTLSAASFGLSHFESVVVQGEDGYMFFYVPSSGKVMAFQTATLTPAGSVSITPHADSAGVPAGTNSAPALTMNAYQPEGTNAASAVTITHIADTTGLAAVYANTAGVLYAVFGDAANHDVAIPAQTFTGTTATLTGSVAAPTFTGTTMGTHSHASTATFTGTGTTASALAEVGNGTSMASVDKVTILATGW